MEVKKVVFVAGHNGMVGNALADELGRNSRYIVLTENKADLDLTNQKSVQAFFNEHTIHEVYLAAAKVGGIHANSHYPAFFAYENMMIQNNVIHAAWSSKVDRLLFLGSSCIYPRLAEQPMKLKEIQ